MAGENETVSARSLASLKDSISSHWKQLPAAAIALRIIEALEAGGAPANKWRTSDILGLLGEATLTPEAMAALVILTQSQYAVFRTSAEFVDEKNNLHPLSSDEFQRVLDTDTLTHPVTGEELTQASAHVVPFFELETDLFSRGAAL